MILNKIINIVNQYSFYTGFTKDIIPILEYEFSKGVISMMVMLLMLLRQQTLWMKLFEKMIMYLY